MALIGCNERFEPYEIAAYCDNIQWSAKLPEYDLRCDMFFGNNCLRFYSREFIFVIEQSLSTTEIKWLSSESTVSIYICNKNYMRPFSDKDIYLTSSEIRLDRHVKPYRLLDKDTKLNDKYWIYLVLYLFCFNKTDKCNETYYIAQTMNMELN